MIKVTPISAFSDNYIWLLHKSNTNAAYVVDPGVAAPVIDALSEHNLQLQGILITHHHWDHTDGIEELLAHKHVPVYGPRSEYIPLIDHPLSDSDTLDLPALNTSFQIMSIAGHTLDHIAYYNENILFCGDTLFAGGCGRLFEGDPPTMYDSLTRLCQLPDETLVYCAHEYTLDNLKFAATVDASNTALAARIKEVSALRQHNKITLPSTIGLEKSTNPFLRCQQAALIQSAENYSGTQLTNEVAVFTILRNMKNHF